MTTTYVASAIAALLQNIVYIVFNLHFYCSSGKQPPQQPNHQQPCEYHQQPVPQPVPQPLNQNQSQSHTEINVVNNQNEPFNEVKQQSDRNNRQRKKPSKAKDTNDQLQIS